MVDRPPSAASATEPFAAPARSSAAAVVCAGVGLLCLLIAAVCNEWVLGALITRGGHVTNPASRVVLALIDLVALGVGLVFVIRRDRAPWREMILAAGSTAVALGAAEGLVRGWLAAQARVAPREREVVAGIGWQPVAHASFDGEMPGFGHVRYHTGDHGFRMFGDPATTKPKVLVIGDSFTEAATVSDGETYYHRLAAARPDLEFFAIGAGGYGTLQELMLVEKWADVIHPDLVLLQMHPNDLINNSHALESRSTTNNNQMVRPYWEQGHVVQAFPENRDWGVLYALARHSALLKLLNVNVMALRARDADSIERTLTANDPDVRAATEVTVDLLRQLRARAGVPVVAFSVRSEAFFPFWSRADVCARAGVTFIPGVGEAVDAAIVAGEPVTGLPVDSHWNGRGHAMASEILTAWLASHPLPTLR